MSAPSAAARPSTARSLRAAAALAVAALAAALVPALATVPANGAVVAPAAAVAAPAAPDFTGAADPFPEYQGQTTCTPNPKPGAAKLRDLITRTYGSYSIGIYRDCSIGGVSEHKEGRALDWMVSVRNATQKAKAEAFLAWLTATDGNGDVAAMARRLGVMYIGWNNKFWRGYDVNRGWTELKGCFDPAKAGTAYDTDCHRNHVHLSLTWEGAMGLTSFWSGKTLHESCWSGWGPQPGAAVAGGDLVPVAPVRVLDTVAGTGLDQPCRLGAPRWDGDDRMLAVRVTGQGDVPQDGVATVALRVTTWATSAPTPTVRVRSISTAASVPAVSAWTTASYGSTVIAPVASDGTVRLSLDRGTAEVRVDVVGWAPPAVTPGIGAAALAGGTVRTVASTTSSVSGTGTALAPGETRTIDLSGTAGMPADGLTGVAVALTAAKTSSVAVVNVSTPGSTSAVSRVRTSTSVSRVAQALVPTTDGRITLRNTGKSSVAFSVRVQGWFTAAPGAGNARTTLLAAPVAVLNTETGLGLAGAFTSSTTRTLTITGKAGVPVGAKAVLVQVSYKGGSTSRTLWVKGSGAVPAVSSIPGRWAHDLVLLPLGADGTVGLSTSSYGAHARLAVVGYAA